MKIAPLNVNDPWSSRMMSDRTTEAQTLTGVGVDAIVEMDRIEILHHGPDHNYRPYLHLSGRLDEVEPEPDTEFPYGITSLPYGQGTGPRIDAFYEFDNAQLTDLVAKDYFGPDFQVPEAMTGIKWALPATVDMVLVAPEYEDDAPFVFVGVHNRSNLALDADSSGYDLAEYFPDYTSKEAVQEASRIKNQMQGRPDQPMNDLFAGVDLGQRGNVRSQRTEAAAGRVKAEAPVPSGVFAKLLAEVEQRRAAEEAQADELLGHDPDSVEGIYADRIDPGVEAAFNAEVDESFIPTGNEPDAEAVTEPEAEEQVRYLDIDAGDDSDLSVTPVDTGKAGTKSREAHRLAIQREEARRRAQRPVDASATEDAPEQERGLGE